MFSFFRAQVFLRKLDPLQAKPLILAFTDSFEGDNAHAFLTLLKTWREKNDVALLLISSAKGDLNADFCAVAHASVSFKPSARWQINRTLNFLSHRHPSVHAILNGWGTPGLSAAIHRCQIPLTALVPDLWPSDSTLPASLFSHAHRLLFSTHENRRKFRSSMAQEPVCGFGMPELDVMTTSNWDAERIWQAMLNTKRGTHRFTTFEDVKALMADVFRVHREFPTSNPSVPDQRLACLPPNEHHAIKSISQPVFTPKRVRAKRKVIEEITDELLANVGHSEHPFDLFQTVLKPFVGRVVTLFFGIPSDLAEPLQKLAGQLPLGIPVENLMVDHEHILEEMYKGYDALLSEVYAQQTPENTLIHALQMAEASGKINRIQLQHTVNSALDGSLGTMYSFVCGMMHYFACHPEKWMVAKSAPAVVEEMLRYLSPASNFLWGRATENFTLNGCPVQKGDRIEFDIFQANHDPQAYQSPDEVRFDRGKTPSLALGHGPHFCLGAGLAREAAEVLIEKMTAKWPRLKCPQTPQPPDEPTQWGQIPNLMMQK